jgi:dienelactone hydrolase
LPAVLALHDHGAFKFLGREKIADGPDGPNDAVLEFRRHFYESRAFANELARRGFVVLVHDAFLWGSRRFEADVMQEELGTDLEEPWVAPDSLRAGGPVSVPEYNCLAARHEHVVAKYCSVLGTSLAGVVAYEDRVALEYLRSRRDVLATSIGCIGLSGGGCRAALLNAVSPYVSAAVVVGMMTTYEGLLDRHVGSHTWMFFPPGLGSRWDWPELASCRAPSPLMVLYMRGDQLFTLQGMQDAHAQIGLKYQKVGHPDAYLGTFYDGGHRFDGQMQEAAFDFLAGRLSTV